MADDYDERHVGDPDDFKKYILGYNPYLLEQELNEKEGKPIDSRIPVS